MTKTTDSLASAVARLGAVEVAPGRYALRVELCPHGCDEYHCHDEPTTCPGTNPRWVTMAERDLEPYKNGRRGVSYTAMPSWWRPDSRFAWRLPKGSYGVATDKRFKTRDEAEASAICGEIAERITADLETGAEVPA